WSGSPTPAATGCRSWSTGASGASWPTGSTARPRSRWPSTRRPRTPGASTACPAWRPRCPSRRNSPTRRAVSTGCQYTGADPHLALAGQFAPGPTSPWDGPGRSHRPPTGARLWRAKLMLRLQPPLPDDYTLATPAALEGRIAAAKAELSDRLLILGHHYQRDEVIRWADARGDSLKLARYAAENDWASDIVFCGVHFMAESADVLTGPEQRVVLPDLNAGGEGVRRPPRRRLLHVVQRPGRADLGPGAGRPGPVRARPAPRPQHRPGAPVPALRHGGVEPPPRAGRPRGPGDQGRPLPAVEGPLLGPPAVHAGAGGRRPGRAPRRRGGRPPRVRPRGGGRRRQGRLHRADPGLGRGGAGRVGPGRRHRDPHGAPHGCQPPRQDDLLPRSADLPLLDDVPHRRASPGLVPRLPSPGRGRQPDHGRRGDRRRRPPGTRPDAGHRLM